MNLYIRIRNNVPIEHPISEDNFIAAFPNIDVKNLPSDFAFFERVKAPELGPYEKNLRCSYIICDDGIVRDVWTKELMSDKEIEEKQNEVKSWWAVEGFNSWAFNADTCSFEPPIPYPIDGGTYSWDEKTISWVNENVKTIGVSRV